MRTRREALAGASAAAAALALPAVVHADDSQDRALLVLLVAYSGEVLLAYEQALRDAPLRPKERGTLTRFAAQAREMDDALRSVLRRLGGTPVARRAPSAEPATRGREPYMRAIVRDEEILVAAWYRALSRLAARRLVAGAAAYMAAGGRRLVVMRDLAGLPLLPRAFETGGL